MAHDNGLCSSDQSALMFCIRHGETHWNATEKLQGQMNVPLNHTGRQQAHAAGTYLAAHYGFGKAAKDIIVSSDLDRAVETATIIGAVVGLPVFTHPLLRETSLGVWQGLTWSEVEDIYPVEISKRKRDPDYVIPPACLHDRARVLPAACMPDTIPEAESYRARFYRVAIALHAIGLSFPGHRIVCVNHGGILDDIARLCGKVEYGSATRTRKVNAGISILEFTPEERLVAEAQLAVSMAKERSKGIYRLSTPPLCALVDIEDDHVSRAAFPSSTYRSLNLSDGVLDLVSMAFNRDTINPAHAADALGRWRVREWGITAHLHVIEERRGEVTRDEGALMNAMEAGSHAPAPLVSGGAAVVEEVEAEVADAAASDKESEVVSGGV